MDIISLIVSGHYDIFAVCVVICITLWSWDQNKCGMILWQDVVVVSCREKMCQDLRECDIEAILILDSAVGWVLPALVSDLIYSKRLIADHHHHPHHHHHIHVCYPHASNSKYCYLCWCWCCSFFSSCKQQTLQNYCVIWYRWTKHYTGTFRISIGDHAGQGLTGEVKSRRIYEEWDSSGKRWKQQLPTDKDGVTGWIKFTVKCWKCRLHVNSMLTLRPTQSHRWHKMKKLQHSTVMQLARPTLRQGVLEWTGPLSHQGCESGPVHGSVHIHCIDAECIMPLHAAQQTLDWLIE